MRRLISYVILLLISVGLACSKSQETDVSLDDSGMKRYEVESGIIHYTTSHETIGMKGTEVVYFDNWGMREGTFRKTETSMMGMKQKSNTMNLWDGEWNYSVDLETNTGTKMKNPMIEGLSQRDAKEMGDRMLKAFGGEKVGTEEFLGKMCDVYVTKTV